MKHDHQDFPRCAGRRARWSWLGWSLLAGHAAASAQALTPAQWLLHTGGVSHHFEQTRAPGREWNERHPGLGLERRPTDTTGWHWRQSVGVLQDSRNVWGGYAGASLMRQWQVPGVASVGLGLGGYGFYRSVSWSGRRAWVPALLPTLSLGLLDEQIGLNLMVVPPVTADGDSRAALVYLQMTYRFQ